MSTSFGARLSFRDVKELDEASDRLVVVANSLQATRYANGPALVKLLSEANDSIERIKVKGAAAIARHLERKQGAAASSEAEIPSDQENPQGEDQSNAAAQGE